MTSEPGVVTVKGRIEKLFYQNPKFSAGRLRTPSNDTITFAGAVFARENEPVVLTGRWTTHEIYGRQFAVERMEYNLSLDNAGLAQYLANHPDIKGIGPAKAYAIVQQFGSRFEEVLLGEPEKLATAAKVPLSVIEAMQKIWQDHRYTNNMIAWLSSQGLTHHQVMTVIEELGTNAKAVLKNDPYSLIGMIPGFGFRRVDEIARKLGTPKEAPIRIRAGIVHLLNEELHEGHCWTESMDLIEAANKLLIMDCLDSKERIAKELEALICECKLAEIPFDNRMLIALPKIHWMEERLHQMFLHGADGNPHADKLGDPDRLIETISLSLNDGQKVAVKTALLHPLVLISGGAGVGKSRVVAAITEAYESRDLKVLLAAPTGKAAKRIEQVSKRPASTVHRLLGYDGKEFTHDESNPISADVVIIDEVSLMDVPLMYYLLRSIQLKKTAVVLVGDHNQLPPVGPGNPLRDLIQTKVLPTVILDVCVRQAGELKDKCAAILNGLLSFTNRERTDARKPWYMIDTCAETAQVHSMLGTLFSGVLAEKFGFDIVRDVQVLTPTHNGELGTLALNLMLQSLVQKKLYGVDVPATPANRRPRLLLHDKIIQTRNNYALQIFNGSLGTIVDVISDGTLIIDFDSNIVKIKPGTKSFYDLELAYALTIHRAQGSEYPCAIVITHSTHQFMHHRNLLYTAVTRAQETAIILGDGLGVSIAVDVKKQDKRRTFLSFLLAGPELFEFPKEESSTGLIPELW